MRRAAIILTTAAVLGGLAGCGSPVDSWAASTGDRLREAGVTFPPEQERTTVVTMVLPCMLKKSAWDSQDQRIWADSTSSLYDWITPMEAYRMWDLADAEFCASVPDGPLGEGK